MKIAFLEPHLELYGGIRRIIEFANRFADRGVDTTIFHPSGETCHWMECRARTRPSAELHGESFDVLVFNEPHFYREVRRADARLKVHYILGLYERDRLVSFDPRIYWPRRGRTLTLKRCLQLPFLHVSNSTWMQRWLRERAGIETELQLGGIDRSLFRPVPVTRDDDAFRVLCNGNPSDFKGTGTILEAVDLVRRRHSNVEVETYHGRGLPQSEMAACYSAADVFVDAQWHGGWNNPVLEAMACGTPVVCSDIGAVEDFAFDGRTALLAPVRDGPAFAAAIERLIEDPQLRERLAAAALEHVARFDWDRSADSFLEMLGRHLEAEAADARAGRTG